MGFTDKSIPAVSYYLSLLKYFFKFHKWPKVKKPENINEKILHLEFLTDTSKWSDLSDKYKVREYVEQCGIGDILVPLIGVYNSADDIDFSTIPDQFVIKLNNGYGDVVIVEDKSATDLNALREKMRKQLAHPFGKYSGEPHYLRIKPKIIVEQLLPKSSDSSQSIVDYKIWCFNGRARYCMVCYNRNIAGHKCDINLYELPKWVPMPQYMHPDWRKEHVFEKPANLDTMISYAEILAKDFPLVRIDFYNIDGKIYFGEMTFSSNAGRMRYFTDQALLDMGRQINL